MLTVVIVTVVVALAGLAVVVFVGRRYVAVLARKVSAADEAVRAATALVSSLRAEAMENVRKAVVESLRADRAATQSELQSIGIMTSSLEHVHSPLLLAAVGVRIPVWIWGDAGSGKSTAARIAAETLGLPFGFVSVCPTTTKSDLLGYLDANGTYRRTEFRERFEHGGVFLIDEIDNGNAQVLAVLNNALANGMCAFPDGIVRRHADCVIVAAANTIGRGANMRFVGRSPVDATTLDRFVFVRMDIDEHLEAALLGQPDKEKHAFDLSAGGEKDDRFWLARVRKVRRAVQELGIDHVVSPRATFHGSRLLKAGVGLAHVEEMTLWKGMRDGDREKVDEHAKRAA